ncbi:hypothetical protein V1525DRAFT_62983 [Lipomyces kononenkoae]|uniref:Uncharacterized protein n=1 Tax=Lipomyces kononenkoae TaxID=34357 RepID=A0ACC3T579_LIPKO
MNIVPSGIKYRGQLVIIFSLLVVCQLTGHWSYSHSCQNDRFVSTGRIGQPLYTANIPGYNESLIHERIRSSITSAALCLI